MSEESITSRLIEASAGTGKTFQLTRHYVALLERGESPASVLATTFTRKAAGEILDRVMERLSDAGAPVERLERVVESMPRLLVLTLDAFLARVVSALELELSLRPGWRVGEADELEALRDEAVEIGLSEAMESGQLTYLSRLAGLPGSGVHGRVVQVVRTSQSALVATLADAEAWRRIKPVGEVKGEAEVEALAAGVERAQVPLTRAGKENARWSNARARLALLLRAGKWKAVANHGLVVNAMTVGTYYRDEIEEPLLGLLREAWGQASAVLTLELHERTLALREVLTAFYEARERLKRRRGVIEFNDLARALLSADRDGMLSHVFYRLDASIRHVLLDEFQDTSIEQFAAIKPLVDEVLGHEEAEGRTVLCVGDVKQSLYGWRGAEAALMGALPGWYPKLTQDALTVNRRSSPAVIDAVNGVFSRLTQPGVMGVSEAGKWFAREFRQHEAHEKDRPGVVRMLEVGGEDLRDAMDMAAAKRAAAAARALTSGPAAGLGRSVAVLVRTNRRIAPIMLALRELGIEASEEGGNRLSDAPAVAAAESLLWLADHPGDTAAAHHVATTALGGAVGLPLVHSDEARRAAARRVRERLVRQGFAGTLSWLARETCGAMSDEERERFEQLIEMGRAVDARGPRRPEEMVRRMRAVRVEKPTAATVRVMTVHASKGLEFDAVILAEVEKPWSLKAEPVLVVRSEERIDRIESVTAYPNEMLREMSTELKEAHAQAHDRMVRGELCGLYVAMTRAKRVLEIVVPAEKPASKGSKSGGSEEKGEGTLSAAKVIRGALGVGGAAAEESEGEEGREATEGAEEFERVVWSLGRHVHSPAESDEAVVEALQAVEDGREARSGAPGEACAARRVVLASFAKEARAEVNVARLPRVAPSGMSEDAEEGAGVGGRGDGVEEDGVGAAWGLAWGMDGEAWENPAQVGEMWHAWFERVAWVEEGVPSVEALTAEAVRRGWPEGEARRQAGAFGRVMEGEIGAALSRARYGASGDALMLWRERPFVVVDRDATTREERVVAGRMDRVVVGVRDGVPRWAEVVDFKTDRVGSEGVEAAARGHAGQMEAYVRAVSRQLKLPRERVGWALAMTGPSRVWCPREAWRLRG